VLESGASDCLQSAPNRKWTRIDPAIVVKIPARPHHGDPEIVLPLCPVLLLSASRNSTRIMARRRSLSTALPAPFASLRVGHFPPVTGPALCRACSCPRYEKTRKGQDHVEHRGKAGRLHPRHQQDHHLTGAGRQAVDETLERRTCGEEDHAAASPYGQPYSSIHILMLSATAMEQGFAAPIWMTFKQALDLNAHVRKGEKGSLLVYANSITRTEHDDSGEDIEREIPFLKGYIVFNVEQIDGLPEIYYTKAESQLTAVERIARAEEFFKHIPVTLKHGGNRAYYAEELDDVQMPIIEAFRGAESCYATLGHAFIHSTKHPMRVPGPRFRPEDLGR
jgi:hypothetical protein